jgi:hypothetical protein
MNSASWSSSPPRNASTSNNTMTDWMNKISDSTLCDYFYIFFIVYAIVAAVALIGAIWMFAVTKSPNPFIRVFPALLSFGISGTTSLFFYLICERALKPNIAMQSQPTPDY